MAKPGSLKLVDWEENPGLGTEINNGNNYYPGDGGFIAQFSDGTVTDATWKAQVFYIAPIQNLNDVVEKSDGTRSTATATLTPTCNANCYGVHYPVPANWTARNFNETGWVQASLYTAAQVTNQAAFKNFETTAWANAKFIWTSNLVLDNLVLVRKTVGTTHTDDIDHQQQANIKVGPNPFSGYIFAENTPQNATFELTNPVGQVVFYGKNIEQTDFSNLPKGTYFLKILSKNPVTFKLIKV